MKLLDNEIICGQRQCQTRDVKWIMMDKVFEKFCRPNTYDLGGSYTEDFPDLWFNCKTEIVDKIYLLHILVVNPLEGYVNLSIATNNNMTIKKKQNEAFITTMHKKFQIAVKPLDCNYISTYSFTDVDVEMLKHFKIYISVVLHQNSNLNETEKEIVLNSPDFSALLNDQETSDFIIESADGVNFHVHKCILSANSEVFNAMLKENTAESQNNYMRMVDVESEDLKHIIYFMYTGTIEDLDNCIFANLMVLGDKYDLKGLVELSKHVLMCQLNRENVIDILTTADMCSCEDLKMAALKFIKMYKVHLDSTIIDQLNSIKLVKDVFKFVNSN